MVCPRKSANIVFHVRNIVIIHPCVNYTVIFNNTLYSVIDSQRANINTRTIDDNRFSLGTSCILRPVALTYLRTCRRDSFSQRRKTLIHYRANAIIIVSSEPVDYARRAIYLSAATRDPIKTNFQLTEDSKCSRDRDEIVFYPREYFENISSSYSTTIHIAVINI